MILEAGLIVDIFLFLFFTILILFVILFTDIQKLRHCYRRFFYRKKKRKQKRYPAMYEQPDSELCHGVKLKYKMKPIGYEPLFGKKEKSLRVVVVNGYIEPYPMNMRGAPKFANHEMDNHILFVRPLDDQEGNEFGVSDVIQVFANKYRDRWDDIPEFALGNITYIVNQDENPLMCKTSQFQIELDIDEKTDEFIVRK
jgi:hypothetical protein